MTPESNWRVTPRHAWAEYVRLFRGDFTRLFFAVVLSTSPSMIGAATALLVRREFDKAFGAKDQREIALLALAFIVLQVVGIGLALGAKALSLDVTKRATTRLRIRLFDTLLRLSRSVHDRTESAVVHTIVVDDSEKIDGMSSTIVSNVLPSAASAIFLGGAAIYISLRLSIILAVVLPFGIFLGRAMRTRTRMAMRAYRDTYARYSGSIFSAIRLLDLTRAQAGEREAETTQAVNIDEMRTDGTRVSLLTNAYPMLHQLIVVTVSGIILMVGGIAVKTGRMTAGELMAFFAAIVILKNQIAPLAYNLSNLVTGEHSLERAFGFLEHAEVEPYSGTASIDFDGSIAAENVSFHYGDGTPILESVSFRLEPGSIVVLTGENGCGKTTLLHLLLGFYAPVSGRFVASGEPYDKIDIRELRSRIGFVGQNAMILDATVRENITFGVGPVSDEEIRDAISLGCANELVAGLPRGLDTRVGEDGVLLSGGQRQRVALSRALLRKPRLLILDEPTNHLDRATVSAFLRNLRRTPWPHATLVVSHDPAVVAEADEVLAMRAGKLVPVSPRDAAVPHEAVS